MDLIEVATLTVRREFFADTYTSLDGKSIPCLVLKRDCGLGCHCEASILMAAPSAALAEEKCLCFNDLKKQGISEVPGTSKPLKEGPDEWIYEVTANLIEARSAPKNGD